MHDAEMLIPIALFAMVFGIFYVRSRENMALIERGINPRGHVAKTRPSTAMRFGLILLGAGLGLLTAYFLILFAIPPTYIEDGVRLHRDTVPIYFALIAIGGGLGLIIAYLLERKDEQRLTPKRQE